MESVCNIKTHKYFDVSKEDFDKFQEIFSQYEPNSGEDAVGVASDEKFSREYTDDEIKSIFKLDCEYSGKDKEMAKDEVADYSERREAMDEVKEFINSGKSISLKSAKTIAAVMEAFESYECEIESGFKDDDDY